MPNAGFLLAEDAALKERLTKALHVSDDRSADRKVQVFFRYPESETERTYPFATIEMINLTHARQRQLSEVTYFYSPDEDYGYTTIDYFPSEYDTAGLADLAGASPFLTTEQMIPVDLTYQISTYCRSQRHDRELTANILRHVFPFRWSFIIIPEDNTSRRCELLNWTSADILDQEAGYKKRIFRKVYTIQVNSEIPQRGLGNVQQVSGVVSSIDGTISTLQDSISETW